MSVDKKHSKFRNNADIQQYISGIVPDTPV